MITLNEREMLEQWYRACGHVRFPSDEDLSPVESQILLRIESWYAQMLLNAAPELLPTEDLAADCQPIFLDDNTAWVPLPARAVRPVSIRMQGWDSDVYEFGHPASDVSRMQRYQGLRATTEHPVVIRHIRALRVCGVSRGLVTPLPGGSVPFPVVESLVCVVRPESGTFVLDASLLSHLQSL